MNAQEQFWAGDPGKAYTDRNRVRWRQRMPFWQRVDEITGARSYYEFGCNAGWNLSAIRAVNPTVAVSGHDINGDAISRATFAGLDDVSLEKPGAQHWVYARELAFTAGVLIHIAPDNLRAFMQRVIDASCIWVLAVEYEAEAETEIEYRGQRGLLWKRPFGKIYESMGLRTVAEFDAEGFDRCRAWLMEKP